MLEEFFEFLTKYLSHGFVEGKNNRTKALMRNGYQLSQLTSHATAHSAGGSFMVFSFQCSSHGWRAYQKSPFLKRKQDGTKREQACH